MVTVEMPTLEESSKALRCKSRHVAYRYPFIAGSKTALIARCGGEERSKLFVREESQREEEFVTRGAFVLTKKAGSNTCVMAEMNEEKGQSTPAI